MTADAPMVDVLLGERWRVDYTDTQRAECTRVDGFAFIARNWGAGHVCLIWQSATHTNNPTCVVKQRNGKLVRMQIVDVEIEPSTLDRYVVGLACDTLDQLLPHYKRVAWFNWHRQMEDNHRAVLAAFAAIPADP